MNLGRSELISFLIIFRSLHYGDVSYRNVNFGNLYDLYLFFYFVVERISNFRLVKIKKRVE